jgi:hypothetical protein
MRLRPAAMFCGSKDLQWCSPPTCRSLLSRSSSFRRSAASRRCAAINSAARTDSKCAWEVDRNIIPSYGHVGVNACTRLQYTRKLTFCIPLAATDRCLAPPTWWRRMAASSSSCSTSIRPCSNTLPTRTSRMGSTSTSKSNRSPAGHCREPAAGLAARCWWLWKHTVKAVRVII